MESELLKIFDERRNFIGTAPREEVHRVGHWHETFHCWFIEEVDGELYIYLQIRSETKKDYPGLLDITAAGHLLTSETVYDGVREVEEELGVEVTFSDLISLGIIHYSVKTEDIIDKEFAHVFLYKSQSSFKDYKLQTEEVSGIVRARFEQFAALWLGKIEEIQVEGFGVNKLEERISIEMMVTKKNFVMHEQSYYEAIIRGINKIARASS